MTSGKPMIPPGTAVDDAEFELRLSGRRLRILLNQLRVPWPDTPRRSWEEVAEALGLSIHKLYGIRQKLGI